LKKLLLILITAASFCDGFTQVKKEKQSGFRIPPDRKKTWEYKDTVWLVSGWKPISYPYKKWKIDLIFDARATLISNTAARLGGFRIGMEHRRVHRFGVGFYGIANEVIVTSLKEVDAEIDTARLNLSYTTIFYERVYYFSKRWELSSAIHAGTGKISGSYHLKGANEYQDLPRQRVYPVEISTSGYYNITWWLSVGGGVGYRFLRDTPNEAGLVYSAPVSIAKIKFKFFKLLKSIPNSDVKDEY